jgi:hypothetical protein
VWCPAHADAGTVIHLEDPDVLAAARDVEHTPCVPQSVGWLGVFILGGAA